MENSCGGGVSISGRQMNSQKIYKLFGRNAIWILLYTSVCCQLSVASNLLKGGIGLVAQKNILQETLNGAIVSPDGRQFAVYGSALQVYDLASMQLAWEVREPHSQEIVKVAFSPDGKKLISCSCDKTVKIWASSTGKCSCTFCEHQAMVMVCGYLTDSKTVVSGDANGVLIIWESKTGKVVRSIAGHNKAISSLAVSMDGRQIATADYGLVIKVWNTKDGSEYCCLLGHDLLITSLLFLSPGNKLLSGSQDGTVCTWDLQKKTLLGKCATNHPVYSFDLINFTTIIIGSLDYNDATGQWKGFVELWDFVNKEKLCDYNWANNDIRSVSTVGNRGQALAASKIPGKIYLLNADASGTKTITVLCKCAGRNCDRSCSQINAVWILAW